MKAKNAYFRIAVKRAGEARPTTISLTPEQYAYALKLTDGNTRLVSSVFKSAALSVSPTTPSWLFSKAVRTKAVNKLRGMHRPKKTPGVLELGDLPEVQLAEVDSWLAQLNNEAWAATL